MKKRKSEKSGGFANQLAKTLATTSKQLIWLFSVNGIAWIWCSYILAFMGRDQIAEALSSNVCTVVIGQMICYLVTKTVENVFQYNDIFHNRSMPNGADQSGETPFVQAASPSVAICQNPVLVDGLYTSVDDQPEEETCGKG